MKRLKRFLAASMASFMLVLGGASGIIPRQLASLTGVSSGVAHADYSQIEDMETWRRIDGDGYWGVDPNQTEWTCWYQRYDVWNETYEVYYTDDGYEYDRMLISEYYMYTTYQTEWCE
ncbi:MAG TPA: hypothetical protein VM124_03200 [Candidatus Limnocylindrales bacterium]|nr:hypothetical protein [Candidatus Limnocylindrales bacterium]